MPLVLIPHRCPVVLTLLRNTWRAESLLTISTVVMGVPRRYYVVGRHRYVPRGAQIPCPRPSSRWLSALPGCRPLVRIESADIDMVIGGQPGPEFDSARLRVASMRIFRLFWHHFVEDIPGGIMFEDQTVDLLPARTTLQTGT